MRNRKLKLSFVHSFIHFYLFIFIPLSCDLSCNRLVASISVLRLTRQAFSFGSTHKGSYLKIVLQEWHTCFNPSEQAFSTRSDIPPTQWVDVQLRGAKKLYPNRSIFTKINTQLSS